jgi:hypothetical protein
LSPFWSKRDTNNVFGVEAGPPGPRAPPPGPKGGGPPKSSGGPGGRSVSFCDRAAGGTAKDHKAMVSKVRIWGFIKIVCGSPGLSGTGLSYFSHRGRIVSLRLRRINIKPMCGTGL